MIGQKIKEIIAKKGLTQTQIAKDMGRSVALVNFWISNERDMSTEDIQKFCKLYNTTPNYLMGFEEVTEADLNLLRAIKSLATGSDQTQTPQNLPAPPGGKVRE